MNIVLVHPVYGAKVATMPPELEQDLKNGWVRYEPEAPKELKVRNRMKSTDETPAFLTPIKEDSEGV